MSPNLASPSEMYPWDVMQLTYEQLASSPEIRARLLANLPNWTDWHVGSKEVENQAVIGRRLMNWDQVTPPDRRRSDYHQVGLACLHGNRLILESVLSQSAPRKLDFGLRTTPLAYMDYKKGNYNTPDLWEQASAAESMWVSDLKHLLLTALRLETEKATREGELAIVMSVRAIMDAIDIDQSLVDYFTQRVRTQRKEVYSVAKHHLPDELYHGQAEQLAYGLQVKQRLLRSAAKQGRSLTEPELKELLAYAQGNQSKISLKYLLLSWKYRGLVKRLIASAKPQPSKLAKQGSNRWDANDTVFDFELSAVSEAMKFYEKSPPQIPLTPPAQQERATDPVLFDQYYALFREADGLRRLDISSGYRD